MKNEVKVLFKKKLVGTIVETKDHLAAFEYDKDWLKNGFSISPFSLPLREGVFLPKNYYFNGLFGVFSDSLPDSWGRLLIKRKLIKENIKDESELFKLTLISKFSMGALEYFPSIDYKENIMKENDFDKLSVECQNILDNKESDNFDILFKNGGSSGGARPKMNIIIDNEVYLLKFYTKIDGKNAGKREYDYSICAKKCGIDMTQTYLLPSNICDGYFAIKRFDIENNEKIHMVSASGLLECDFNAPSFDYLDLMKLTKILTNNNEYDIDQLFKRMCFNVFSYNLDDHGKNFAFLYDDKIGKWSLSKAYDLTYSNTFYGEHTTSVNGKGKDITDDDLIKVGLKSGMKKDKIIQEIDNIKKIVNNDLKKYFN